MRDLGIWELTAYEGEELFRALASGPRLRILRLLSEREMNINELGQALGSNIPAVSKHVQVLEGAGLVISEYMAGTQGTQKRCRLRQRRLVVSLEEARAPSIQSEEMEMPVGLYGLVHPGGPTCGLASPEGYIGHADEPQSFLLPDRCRAGMLWMSEGFVEYVFPNKVPTSVDIWKAELQMEICSECPDFDNDFPSDITVWFNGVEIGTWTSPGDLGGRRGRLNPPWWNDHGTQYGALKVFSVSDEGAFVDGLPASDVTIAQAKVVPHQPVTVRIGVKPDARHRGGFNLFGRSFGNYQQDLILRLHYLPKSESKRSESAAARESQGPTGILKTHSEVRNFATLAPIPTSRVDDSTALGITPGWFDCR
ncbi:MAG: ArsR/SmtB family transcription factor [Fimbriimonas sp.]